MSVQKDAVIATSQPGMIALDKSDPAVSIATAIVELIKREIAAVFDAVDLKAMIGDSLDATIEEKVNDAVGNISMSDLAFDITDYWKEIESIVEGVVEESDETISEELVDETITEITRRLKG